MVLTFQTFSSRDSAFYICILSALPGNDRYHNHKTLYSWSGELPTNNYRYFFWLPVTTFIVRGGNGAGSGLRWDRRSRSRGTTGDRIWARKFWWHTRQGGQLAGALLSHYKWLYFAICSGINQSWSSCPTDLRSSNKPQFSGPTTPIKTNPLLVGGEPWILCNVSHCSLKQHQTLS